MAERIDYDIVQGHLDRLVPPRAAELAAMERDAAATGFPIIGPVAGHFCYQVARMIGARSVFEMGSGFGYSTAWFARAVVENGGGVVHHVVWDPELSRRAREHLGTLGLAGAVRFHVAEAVAALRDEPGPFDVVFCDIDKDGYPAALPVVASKVRSGGVLIADNVLWHGRIFDPADGSAETSGIRAFTLAVSTDPAWVTSIVPVRDGLLLAWRR